MSIRSLIFSLTTLFCCLLLGCGYKSVVSPRITAKDIVGTWVSSQNPKCVLRFDSNGTVIIRSVPAFIFEGDGTHSKPITSKGRWSIGYSDNSLNIDAYIGLYSMPNEPPMGGQMYAQRDSRGVYIFFPIGDPDALEMYPFSKTVPGTKLGNTEQPASSK